MTLGDVEIDLLAHTANQQSTFIGIHRLIVGFVLKKGVDIQHGKVIEMINEQKIIKSSKLTDAFKAIEKYFNTYHPAGYGTTAKISVGLEGLCVEFSRFESCD